MIHEMEVDDYSFRFDCGFTKAQPAIYILFSDKQVFLKSVWLHCVIVFGELQQFKEGLLDTLNIEQIVNQNHDVMYRLTHGFRRYTSKAMC